MVTHPRIESMANEACDQLWAERGRFAPLDLRNLKEPAVRSRLRSIMINTRIDQNDPKSKNWHSLHPLPGQRKLQYIISQWRKPKADAEDLWSIGEEQSLEASAMGALVAVWKYVTLEPGHEPFTVGLAAWVTRLRFIEAAGGSPTGEATVPGDLFRWAARFSARVKAAAYAKEDNTRTNVLLAQMTMTETQYALATRTGILNAEGIDVDQELITYYPKEGLAASNKAGVEAGGRLDMKEYADAAGALVAQYPAEVRDVWAMTIKLAEDNQQWLILRDDDEHPGIAAVMSYLLLKDVAASYDKGELQDYDPLERIDEGMRFTVHLYNKNGWTNSALAKTASPTTN